MSSSWCGIVDFYHDFLYTDPLLKEDYFYIVNIETNMVLGATSDGDVIIEDFEEDKAEQLWKKGEPKNFASEVFGEPDAEGYFTLENYKEPKFMTAISESCLEIIGNITLRRTST